MKNGLECFRKSAGDRAALIPIGILDSKILSRPHASATAAIAGVSVMANQLGKRYLCEKCGTEVLCNKPGNGAIECCDAEMKIKEAKALPSSD
ncbi:MAG TPA: hypothetical protein VKT27_16755 [Candidatus Binataceae bacterium]|nr:hypothetical protein [Candidatus Binataceae bacterium]